MPDLDLIKQGEQARAAAAPKSTGLPGY